MNQATLQKLNLPFFFLTAFSCYQGALRGVPWLGLIVFGLLVATFLPGTALKKERLLVALLVTAVGFGTDSALVFFRVYEAREASRWLLPAPLCPEWVLTLWLNFGFMLYIFWRLLSRSVGTAVTVGVVFSFLIYGNAARMGLLTLRQPVLVSLGIIALLWAVLIPLFTRCAVSAFAGGNHGVGQE
jgi:hypothetical protein